ncbi:MAG: phosphotyrosine protein phosphatase [Candidatus Eremiobacteraeota bacterium]|nr:phosphotyrosine protein phosphatase [Candidatus Eremiobacteraeota bacterium]MCW5867793.1 phosphotyrosine protein phosphatase [Candidatus Eremiobacteraeota bacterium]
MKVLFVCSRNRLRSPTAQQIFAGVQGWEVDSAGLSPDAEHLVSAEQIEWTDLILVMEPVHRRRLVQRYGPLTKGKRVAVLSIRDEYKFMQPELIELLHSRVKRYLPT